MKPTLLILAAGMGSRYGGLKQIDKFGPSGESIIEYSIYDAIQAGFGKVVFIIRDSFAEDFKALFEPKLKGKIEIEYAFQEITTIPEGIPVHPGREKPWGTGHAVLVAKNIINEPFAIINADDFYGKDAFKSLAQYMANNTGEKEACMVGYQIHKTLSDFGTVSRGVCKKDKDGYLIEITERTKIKSEDDKIFFYEGDKKFQLQPETPVSMNCWAFKPNFFTILEKGFAEFLKAHGQELKSEYFFPFEVSDALNRGQVAVKVLTCNAEWFGVTFPADKPFVSKQLNKLIENGEYPDNLWNK